MCTFNSNLKAGYLIFLLIIKKNQIKYKLSDYIEIQVKKITIKGSIISRNQDFKTKVIENNNKKKSVESFKEDMEQS